MAPTTTPFGAVVGHGGIEKMQQGVKLHKDVGWQVNGVKVSDHVRPTIATDHPEALLVRSWASLPTVVRLVYFQGAGAEVRAEKDLVKVSPNESPEPD